MQWGAVACVAQTIARAEDTAALAACVAKGPVPLGIDLPAPSISCIRSLGELTGVPGGAEGYSTMQTSVSAYGAQSPPQNRPRSGPSR